MNIRAIKTAQTENAVNRIKLMTKKEIKNVNCDIPKIFLEKREYMQSNEFLKDPHNEKMFELGDALYNCRIQIKKEIDYINKYVKNKFVQAINGFSRLQKDLNENANLNYEETPYVNTLTENKYRILRNVEIYAESRKAFD